MPRRKTVSEHKRDGTYRADRHGDRDDDKFEGGEPVVFLELDERAQAMRQVIIDGFPDSALSPMDGMVLDGICELYFRWVDMGTLKGDLAQKLRCRLWGQFVDAAGKFGLTPADRAALKISTKKDTGGENPIDSLLRMRGGEN